MKLPTTPEFCSGKKYDKQFKLSSTLDIASTESQPAPEASRGKNRDKQLNISSALDVNPIELLTTKQLFRATGLSEIYWRIHRMRGTGPCYLKLSRSVRYRPKDVEKWLEQCKQKSTMGNTTSREELTNA